ncbi:hypothetical protein [Candidatus Parabeggiatoa sp. HSG14]|uniref:hypothetical protein n=1 Tax=Candidatus Parabeggiatoa sp. HSG14 TaxID=3055593 RepID=UPI0025A8E90E|nr:hypothetical protein [Thiotrichales bacterium HSG14]
MNKNIRFAATLSSLVLGMSLLFNHSIADEATSVEKTQPPPATAKSSKKLSPDAALLIETVGKYMEAWHNKDFEAMRFFESWEGGKELGRVEYIQSFAASFKVHTWKVTKIGTLGVDKYQLLVLITHSVPADIAGLVPMGKTVRSTLLQWWKKEGDKFVHLYNIEKQELMKAFPEPPPMQSPVSPPSLKSPL